MWKFFGPEPIVKLAPGIMVSKPPSQKKLIGADKIILGDYQLTPLASFDIKAKILSKKRYILDRESDLSPVDLALGWQNMSDEKVIEQVTISQSSRWYHWRVKSFPIPRRKIETQSANMHLIPANSIAESRIDDAKQGQIISLKGFLVRVDSDDGWYWQSSLTRNDTGSGACEIIYVTDVEFIR